MRLTKYTDKMIAEFKAIARKPQPSSSADAPNEEWLQEMALESVVDLMQTAMESIWSTISSMESSTVSSLLYGGSSSTSGQKTSATKEFTIDAKIPAWRDIPAEPVHVFEHQLPRMNHKDFHAGKVDVDLLKRPLTIAKKDRQLKIAPSPFAKGGARLAFYGCDVTPFPGKESSTATASEDDTNLCVLKEFLRLGGRSNSKKSYIEQIEIQAVGMHLALQFNKVKPKESKDIKFLKESLISFHGREKPAYFTKESRIEGEYTKFNNNWGYVNEKEYHALLQAFSHWTWHVTGGFLQVMVMVRHGAMF